VRDLLLAALVTYCGAVGAILWERFMADAPSIVWRFLAFFWLVFVAGIVALNDPVMAQVKLHPKLAIGIGVVWMLLALIIASSKLLRSAQLEMRFVKGRPPYEESGIIQLGNEVGQAVFYRLGIESDKTAQVSVTVDGASLGNQERHDLSLHRMGDLTYKETVTEVSPGRPRYWDILIYVQSRGLLTMEHYRGIYLRPYIP
jgi:hypothetical protein